MKIIFAGTPEVAIPTLEALVRLHDVVGVITRPDAELGRKRVLTPSPVAVAASALGLDVFKTSHFDSETSAFIRNCGAELGVVVAYGALIPRHDLSLLLYGWLNLHFSQLPQGRGAAPLQRDIMAGATVAGISVFQLVSELDAGDVFDVTRMPLNEAETAGEAFPRLAVLGAERMLHVVSEIEANTAVSMAQSGLATYARKLSIGDGRLVPGMSFHHAFNVYRGVTPEPGAWLESSSGRIKILECFPTVDVHVNPGLIAISSTSVSIGFADGGLSLGVVQPAGKTAMPAQDWARGLPDPSQWTFA